jgi:hypothetical protein
MNTAYNELIDFIAAGPSRKAVADFEASQETKRLVEDLIRREKTEGLPKEEREQLDSFLHLEHVMRLAKARARKDLGLK